MKSKTQIEDQIEEQIEEMTNPTAGIGKIQDFVPGRDDVDTYLLQLKHFFKANAITEDGKKVSFFITLVGSKVISTLVDLFSPEDLDAKTYPEIIEKFKKHFQPERLVVSERHKFYSRRQKIDESISEYVVEIKHLAATCKFNAFLEDALRDRLISGVLQEELRQKLISQELTFEKALEEALKFEEANKQKSLLGYAPPVSEVNAIRKPEYQKGKARFSSAQKPNQVRKSYCTRCNGEGHNQFNCPYKTYKCRKCLKVGHLARACRSKRKGRVDEISSNVCLPNTSKTEFDVISKVENLQSNSGWFYSVNIEGKEIKMLIDTGACMSILPEHLYKRNFSNRKLLHDNAKLKTYQGESLKVLGKLLVEVKHKEESRKLPLIVVKCKQEVPALLGRNWLEQLNINWDLVCGIGADPSNDHSLKNLKVKYSNVFDAPLGLIKGKEVSLHLKDDAIPKFCKARTLPFSIKPLVDKELDQLERSGVIYRVPHSEWATPIVVVRKPNNTIRMCADYKVTLNQVLQTEHYKLPTTEELFSHLAKGKIFSHLDLRAAYQQLSVNKNSQKLLTINTHRGLYAFRRLPYGISSAPSAFQEVMDDILKGIKGVVCFIDDVLLISETKEEAVVLLKKVLQKFSEVGIVVNYEKCKFLVSELTYLGYKVNSKGISPTEELVKAIRDAPEPQNVEELRAYLGLLNFYGKFIPNLSSKLNKLYNLLRDTPWTWTSEHSKVFGKSKSWVSGESLLVHFDSTKPLSLTCDASNVGIGCVLSHILEYGEERPIMFASRTLSPAEKRYSQIEREALAIIFAVKKFHKFLFGSKFLLYTDHQALTILFGEKRAIPPIAAARLQRWAIILSAYSYEIKFKAGKDIANADALSRLPVKGEPENDETYSDLELLTAFSDYMQTPITAKDVAAKTAQDPVLSRVSKLILHGWPHAIGDPLLKPYQVRQHELSLDRDCITWGTRVVIPESMRKDILELLHDNHLGMVRTKMLARNFLWWPNLDQDIEIKVKSCEICQATQNSSPKITSQNWPEAKRRWERVHIDFAKDTSDSLIKTSTGHYLLCMVDAFSKWVEVILMNKTTSEETVEKIRSLIAAYGFPEVIVSDNGPQFTSDEFKLFLKNNGIKHLLTPPYHAQSNGAAERTVQTVKKNLLKLVLEEKRLTRKTGFQHKIDNFLFSYRNTPHTSTGKTPAELFLQRRPRTRLSLLLPMLDDIPKSPSTVPLYHVGDAVYVRTVRGEKVSWMPGEILRQRGKVTYDVWVTGQRRYCHIDHLRPRTQPNVPVEEVQPEFPRQRQPVLPDPLKPASSAEVLEEKLPNQLEEGEQHQLPNERSTSVEPSPVPPVDPPRSPRRSGRVRKPPDRWGYDKF